MKHALLTLLLLISVTLSAKTIRVLAIGNSFSEDAVEQYLYELCAENGDQLIIGCLLYTSDAADDSTEV